MLTLEQGDRAKVPSSTSKMHPRLAHPTIVRYHHGTEHLLLIPVFPAGVGWGPAMRNRHMNLPGFLGPGKTRQRGGNGVVPLRPALSRCLMWDPALAASPRRLHAVIPSK